MIVLAADVDTNIFFKFIEHFLLNLFYREQLNKSLELRQNVEKKIKKAKATTATNSVIK
jgi:hypothetical protein